MKKFTLTLTFILCAFLSFGQSPSAFNYQAVLRDASGNIRTNASVTVLIDLIQTSASGTVVYSESFAVTTNAFGLINLQIGKGIVVSGNFSAIDWSAGPYFIKISVDGTEMSSSQLLSVPYALYAAKSGTSFSGNYNELINKPDLFSGNYNDLTNKPLLFSGKYSDLLNRPNLSDTVKYLKKETDPLFNASVAKSIKAVDTTRWGAKSNFSGKYDDLNNKPVYLDSRKNTIINQALDNIEGNYNTGVGSNALYHNIANYNSAFGCNSLYMNLNGKFNVAVGANSLYDNNANGNVGVGFNSLTYNQTGYGNVAIGNEAIRNNVKGMRNTAVGDSALVDSNSDKNTAVGYQSLVKTTGWDNTAVGSSSMSKNTSGFDNSALGVDALSINTTGTGNTAVGKSALITNSTGSNNTAIGFRADVTGNSSNSTAIGFDTKVNSSNKIVLGNGNVTSIGGFASWTNFSDARLKENIVYSNQLGLNFISRLRTASYNYKADQNKRIRNGLIAQDVQNLLENLDMTFSGLVVDDDPQHTLNLSYAEFVIPLINSVQELNEKNRQLQQKNESLEQTLNQMKADLEELKRSVQH